MLDHHCSKAVLLRIEPDGTKVYRKNHKILRVAPSTEPPRPAGFYPGGSREAFYKGHKDPRKDPMFPEMVRERRAQGFKAGVKPGPQHF
jgi:hypothetical protein